MDTLWLKKTTKKQKKQNKETKIKNTKTKHRHTHTCTGNIQGTKEIHVVNK